MCAFIWIFLLPSILGRVHGSRSAGVCASTDPVFPDRMPGTVPRATRNQGPDLLRAIRNRAVFVSVRAETHQRPVVLMSAFAFSVTTLSRRVGHGRRAYRRMSTRPRSTDPLADGLTTRIRRVGGVGYARQRRGAQRYHKIEGERGQYDFSGPDRVVAALERRGIHILILFILDYGNPLDGPPRAVVDDAGRGGSPRWRRPIATEAVDTSGRYGLNRHFPDGWGPSPSLGLDTAHATSQARVFWRRDACNGGLGHLRAPFGLTAAPEDALRAQLDPRLPLRCTLRASAWGWVWRTKPCDPLQDAAEQLTRHRHLGHLENEVATVRDHLRPDLDDLLPQRGQGPLRDLARQRQGAEEVGEVVGQRVQLETDGVRAEGHARQPRPLDRVLPFLDPLARPSRARCRRRRPSWLSDAGS